MTDDDDSLWDKSFNGIGHAPQVEALVKKKQGDHYLKARQAETELARINRGLRQLKTRIAALEERKSKLMADLEVTASAMSNEERE